MTACPKCGEADCRVPALQAGAKPRHDQELANALLACAIASTYRRAGADDESARNLPRTSLVGGRNGV